ncbi:MAG: hypothetical protein GY792_35330, partial [Gammaproteobacteria bacterium]|nr:hypothetical protein [Gammaproteobacteria bacterium]
RLWENLPDGATEIRETDIREAGDVDSALAGYYADRVKATAENTNVRERAIREWFNSQLITEQGIRGQVLRGPEQSQGLENTAIDPLVDAHLVRAENRRGATWYELAHDRLIAPVRKNNVKWFRVHLSPLQRQAALWESQSRSGGLLLRGEALEKAERWAADYQNELTPTERDFLEACREARSIAERERRQARRIRWLAIGATILGIAAMIAFFVAYYQRAEAERLRFVSITQSLAVQALHQQELDQDERGALLARQAYLFNQRNRGHMLNQIDNALRAVLNTAHFNRILHLGGEVTSVAFNPDTQTLAFGISDGTIQLWNLSKPNSAPVVLRSHKRTV